MSLDLQRLLIGLVLISLISNGLLLYLYFEIDDDVNEVDDDIELLTDTLISVHEDSENEVDTGAVKGKMAGYDTQEETGHMFSYEYQPIPSESIYLDIQDVDIEKDFQQSLRNAQDAIDEASHEPGTTGGVISTDTPTKWEFLRGESASLEIAIQMAATNPEYEYNDSVAVTGRINSNGHVNTVDHISAKAEAAADNHTIFIAPYTNYAVNADNIDIVQVQTLDEALDIALEYDKS